MAREYARVHEFYMQMHDLQPPAPHYQYDLMHTNATACSTYELTTGAAPGAGAGATCLDMAGALVAAHLPLQANMPMPQHSLTHQHDQRKKKNGNFSPENYELTSCEVQSTMTTSLQSAATGQRKRKSSSFGAPCAYEDAAGEDSRSARTVPDKKQNHSEIEKRRRDKMNTYISELSAMVPMCGAMARKLDKLTVLRMAVQHMRAVRGALAACPLTARPRPAFVSERELNALILQAAHDSFLLVVGCDRGRLLYTSASVEKMLHYEQSELLGQSLFDILHPKDVAKVKEQLSASDLSPRERLIDAKTMLPVKADMVAGASRLSPGARRSFFCRIKCKASTAPSTPSTPLGPLAPPVKEEEEPAAKLRKKNEKKYCVVQFTGYLKSWASTDMREGTAEGVEEGEVCNLSCLVAMGRALPDLAPMPIAMPAPPTRQLQYVSRHAIDGKFLFVDQRVTLALGFLPQELLGTSLYEYVCGPELGSVARTHKAALLRRTALLTPTYGFRRKDGAITRLQTHFKPFRNPWTKDVECLVANNTIVSESHTPPRPDDAQASYEVFKHMNGEGAEGGASPSGPATAATGEVAGAVSEADIEMQRLIDSQVESHKIGSAIAEEALRRSPNDFAADLPADLLQDVGFNQQWHLTANVLNEQASLVDNILGIDMGNYPQVRNNVPLSAAVGGCRSPTPAGGVPPLPVSPPSSSPPLPSLGIDGNGEAAMAVIMSLLEADAGLGGPVNFSGLPWPLP